MQAATTVINSGKTWMLFGGKNDDTELGQLHTDIVKIECFEDFFKLDCNIVVLEQSLALERSYGLAIPISY